MNMGRGMKWTWALALALGVGAAALARADDDEVKPAKTGSWFTRLFSRNSAAKKVDPKKGELDAPASASPALVRQKALAELMRRQEVCQRLREIALQTGDMDLNRKSEALDQRAYDVYLLRTGGSKGNLSPDEQILEGRLGLEAAQRSHRPGAGGSASASADGRAAVRKD
jgi:hypothetical protein